MRANILGLLLLFPAAVFGQQELQFVQQLSWKTAAGAAFYEVSIEKQAQPNAPWENVLRQQTENTLIQASLKSGHYRYAVTVFDFFGEAASVSPWVEFDVLPALQPEITNIRPSEIVLDSDPVKIALTGKNLLPDSKIDLQKSDGEKPVTNAITRYDAAARTITVDTAKLQAGFYRLVVTNPGGLSCEYSFYADGAAAKTGLSATKRPLPFDLQISEGWTPLIPAYGAFNDLLETEFFPIGLGLRVAILPIRTKFGSFGVEVEPFWHILQAPHGKYIIQAHLIDIQAGILYQLWFAQKRFALNLRATGGISMFFNLQRAQNTRLFADYGNTWIPAVSGGISFSWCFIPPFYIDIGASFFHIFSVDDPPPAYIRPSLFVGFRL
ncbi:hypothetical protein FACS189494_01330 [Spirochaetia bacterium]|nr:hypothetical protein FACS189494_01330 [Spirochaetia bacterium]